MAVHRHCTVTDRDGRVVERAKVTVRFKAELDRADIPVFDRLRARHPRAYFFSETTETMAPA